MKIRSLLPGLVLLASAGAFAWPSLAAAQAASDLRGFVIESLGGMSFTRCGSTAAASVVDKSPEESLLRAVGAVRPVMSQQDRPIYVELRGTLSGKTLTVQRLHRLVGHVADCSSLPNDVPTNARLAAVGTEAPWGFTVTPAGATFTLLGQPPVRFAAAAFAKPSVVDGASRSFDAWSQQDGGTIRITFTEALCKDLGAEAVYGAQVTARLGARTFEGCASRY
jgi:uncharacterized membrane protein